eukprot:TRINITY_DN6742_c0_g2_i2.p1 TRINITY_DN6742_c0_g2~~TRINITY_DN6742_c0_g2_i2.p1  ORF type:complete len:488 (-),score=69.03 TRINITY_DN6742_c0_g2_i2:152-1615(-)
MVDTEKVAKMFIRPPRREYRDEDLNYQCRVPGAQRHDFFVFNGRRERIVGSIWDPPMPSRDAACVIFCHGNYGCRMDALVLANTLLQYGLSVCGFDFSGCGHSQGEFITLGWKEKEDLKIIFDYVKRMNRYRSVVVWGRSMGGATTLFFASECRDPLFKMIVLEAPYASLENCACNQAKKVVGDVPSMIVKAYLSFVDDRIQELTKGLNPRKGPNAGMSLYEMRPVDRAVDIICPGYYGVGDEDDLTPVKDVRSIFDNHTGGPKYFRIYKGGHKFSEGLPQDWLLGAVQFMQMQFGRSPPAPIRTPIMPKSPSTAQVNVQVDKLRPATNNLLQPPNAHGHPRSQPQLSPTPSPGSSPRPGPAQGDHRPSSQQPSPAPSPRPSNGSPIFQTNQNQPPHIPSEPQPRRESMQPPTHYQQQYQEPRRESVQAPAQHQQQYQHPRRESANTPTQHQIPQQQHSQPPTQQYQQPLGPETFTQAQKKTEKETS